jgi:hypothetical protein
VGYENLDSDLQFVADAQAEAWAKTALNEGILNADFSASETTQEVARRVASGEITDIEQARTALGEIYDEDFVAIDEFAKEIINNKEELRAYGEEVQRAEAQ